MNLLQYPTVSLVAHLTLAFTALASVMRMGVEVVAIYMVRSEDDRVDWLDSGIALSISTILLALSVGLLLYI